jgi:hypothetical protein
VRFLHDLAKIDATFDDPNLVSRAGLAPRAVSNQGPGKVVQLFMIVCRSRRGRRAWWLRAAAITPWLTIKDSDRARRVG